MIRGKIRRLPPIHQATLRAMLEHLAKVNANKPSNRMDAKNLAVVFSTVIFGEETLPSGVDILNVAKVCQIGCFVVLNKLANYDIYRIP